MYCSNVQAHLTQGIMISETVQRDYIMMLSQMDEVDFAP